MTAAGNRNRLANKSDVLSFLKRDEDVLRAGVGDGQRLDAELLLDLQRLEACVDSLLMSASTSWPTPRSMESINCLDEVLLEI
jgi:hypothetical protein